MPEQESGHHQPASRVDRPWGWYQVIGETPGSKVKRIHVLPGHKLSLQMHSQRAEHWVVTIGTARVVIGESELDLPTGEHCQIARNQVHRLENRTGEALEIVEIQIGEYLDEDDIIRIADSYGRGVA
jgi:mannose-6-phosphate isomerase-like protein (cupin superfamily)